MNKIMLKFEKNLSAAWPRGLKRRFYGDRVITIAWYRLIHILIVHVVAPFDIKALYDDYLCLVASNKQQI